MKKFISGCCVGFCLTAEGMVSPSSFNGNSSDAMPLLGEQQQLQNGKPVQRETARDGADLSFSSDTPEDEIQENINDDENPDLMSSETQSRIPSSTQPPAPGQIQVNENYIVSANVFDKDLEWSDEISKNNDPVFSATWLKEVYEKANLLQKMFIQYFFWKEYKKRSEKEAKKKKEEEESQWSVVKYTKEIWASLSTRSSRPSAIQNKEVFKNFFHLGIGSLMSLGNMEVFQQGKSVQSSYQDLDFARRYWLESINIVFRWATRNCNSLGCNVATLIGWEIDLRTQFSNDVVFVEVWNDISTLEREQVNEIAMKRIFDLQEAVCRVEIARRKNEEQFKKAADQYKKDKLALTKKVEEQEQGQEELRKQLEQALEASKKVSEENKDLCRRLEELEKSTKEQQGQRSSQKQDAQLLEENFSEKQENTRESPQEKINEKPVETRIENSVSVLEDFDFDFEQSSGSEQGNLSLGRLQYTGGVKGDKPAGLGRVKYGAFAFEAVFEEWCGILLKGWKVYNGGSVLTGGWPSEQRNCLDIRRLSQTLSTMPLNSSYVYRTREGIWIFALGKIELRNQDGETLETIVDLNAQ